MLSRLRQRKSGSALSSPIIEFSEFDYDNVIVGRDKILEINPHRHEFALLDGILLIEEKRVVGFYDVPQDVYWAKGHFPGRPLMPGVLIAEVAAQCTSYLGTVNGIRGDAVIGLAGLENVKFRAPVKPGDRLTVMVLEKKSRKGMMIVTHYQAYVGETLVSEGEIKGIAIKD